MSFSKLPTKSAGASVLGRLSGTAAVLAIFAWSALSGEDRALAFSCTGSLLFIAAVFGVGAVLAASLARIEALLDRDQGQPRT